MRVFYLFNHPAPYKIDFFNDLGKEVELTVVFSVDQEKGRNEEFYSNKVKNFRMVLAHGLRIGTYNAITSTPTKILKKERFDVVVINGYHTFAEMQTIRYLRRKKIPYIIEINGGIIAKRESFFKKWLKSRYIKGANSYLCPDYKSKEYLAYYGANPDLISLYPYSSIRDEDVLPSPLTKQEKSFIRQAYSLPEGNLFVSCGFFYPRKNFLRLIQIYAKVKMPSSLLLIGEGEQRKEIEEEIKRLRLENVILFPFLPHDEVLKVFSCADAFLFLSKEDIYGHVIVEALSQGLPVVSSSEVNAATRLIKQNENGFVVSLDDEERILDAIESSISEKMAGEAIKTAREFTIEKGVEFHVGFLKKFFDAQKGGKE